MRSATFAIAALGLASSVIALALPNPASSSQLEPRYCAPGTWSCNGTALRVYTANGWVDSAYCGRVDCCSVTDNGYNAHCYC